MLIVVVAHTAKMLRIRHFGLRFDFVCGIINHNAACVVRSAVRIQVILKALPFGGAFLLERRFEYGCQL